MGERTIPEILGWERSGASPATFVPRYVHFDPDGRRLADYRFGGDDGITVDDMLAWLARQGIEWELRVAHTERPSNTTISVAYGTPAGVCAEAGAYGHRTLHAAVSAAVRAVAGETDQ